MAKMSQEEINVTLFDEIQRLRDKVKHYEETLEYYSDGWNYTFRDGERIVEIFTDQGEKARRALKGGWIHDAGSQI